jgi:protein-S-isoprenylcysteine O-methyltransferase Ste14
VNLDTFRQTKFYDLLMGLPLILWFGGAAVKLRPSLVVLAGDLLDGRAGLHSVLLLLALFASASFNLLLVWLVVVRDPPVAKSTGLLPRLFGVVGTFLGVGILYLPRPPLPLGWLIVSDALQLVGFVGAALVLAKLGKAFSIMPEARVLVTGGPYAYVRHPLYAVETLCLIGNAILFQQPWAGLIGATVIVVLVIRSHFEEQVLAQTYREYAAYRARTKRFIPGIV